MAYILPGGDSLRPWLHKIRGSRIGKGVWISQLVYTDELYPEAVTIGEQHHRASDLDFNWWQRREGGSGEAVIGKDLFIRPHRLMLSNVRIGDGSVIKGGPIVTKDVPHCTFFGAPPAVAYRR